MLRDFELINKITKGMQLKLAYLGKLCIFFIGDHVHLMCCCTDYFFTETYTLGICLSVRNICEQGTQ